MLETMFNYRSRLLLLLLLFFFVFFVFFVFFFVFFCFFFVVDIFYNQYLKKILNKLLELSCKFPSYFSLKKALLIS